MPAIEAVKCYSAAYRWKIAVCYSNPAELAPGGDQYDHVFTEDLPEEPELFLIPYLILKDCEFRFGYGKRSADFHARSRYLFVGTAFRVLYDLLASAKRIHDEPTQLLVTDLVSVREVLSQETLATHFMQLTEEVMKAFFWDSWVQNQVGQDIFQFLKGPVEREDASRILSDKIRNFRSESSFRALVEEITRALPV